MSSKFFLFSGCFSFAVCMKGRVTLVKVAWITSVPGKEIKSTSMLFAIHSSFSFHVNGSMSVSLNGQLTGHLPRTKSGL